ncbi:MAG: ribosome silencing factor, partial [Planctomycetota bacterium]
MPPRDADSQFTEGAPVIESNEIATAAAWLADQKKGLDIRVLDVREHIKVADYFVIVTGTSRPHIRAIQQEIHVRLKAAGVTHGREEGGDLGWWVLMDYGDVIVHVMQPEAREYYDLDGLYQDATELKWRDSALPELPQVKQRAVG